MANPARAYPYLIKNPDTHIIHVVALRDWAGGNHDEFTGCGMLVDTLDYPESHLPIKRAVAEDKLCRRCLGSDPIVQFLSRYINTHD